MVTLGEETINTGVFIQLDAGQVFLVTEQMMRFVLVGEPASNNNNNNGPVVKMIRVAVFASTPLVGDPKITVYALDDTVDPLQVSATLFYYLKGSQLGSDKETRLIVFLGNLNVFEKC